MGFFFLQNYMRDKNFHIFDAKIEYMQSRFIYTKIRKLFDSICGFEFTEGKDNG